MNLAKFQQFNKQYSENLPNVIDEILRADKEKRFRRLVVEGRRIIPPLAHHYAKGFGVKLVHCF